MLLYSCEEFFFFVQLLIVLSGRIQGAPPDSYSSGDLSRENTERNLQERHESSGRSEKTDLEGELERRVPRKSNVRSRGQGKDEIHRNRQHEEDLENLQLADQKQIGRLVKNLQLQIKESRTSQVRTR